MAWRFCSLNSSLTGRPVFFCRTIARSAVYPPAATSSTRMATTSQPRSLLSIARLNMARSRARPSIWSFVRIDQTCWGRSGGFAPVSFPLFHGARLGRRSHSHDPARPYSSARLQRARANQIFPQRPLQCHGRHSLMPSTTAAHALHKIVHEYSDASRHVRPADEDGVKDLLVTRVERFE